MNFRPRRREPPELNLIPMIDVLIVLLIFLVLTTTFSREAQLRINLPEATGEPADENKGIEVVIDAAGGLRIGERELADKSPEAIRKGLREAAGDRRDPVIVIDADRNATHQSVMSVLDAASQAGFPHVTFAAKSDPGAKP
jgi:biopolymer transport protein ExbD